MGLYNNDLDVESHPSSWESTNRCLTEVVELEDCNVIVSMHQTVTCLLLVLFWKEPGGKSIIALIVLG